MSELCRMVNVSGVLTKDRINVLKTKGVNTIFSSIEITDGVADRADAIASLGSDVHSLGLKWCVNLGLAALYQGVASEVGTENRMFVRKAERAGFENVHKLFTKFAGAGAAPDFVQIEVEVYSEITGLTLSFEEQTRMINACINAAKAASPECRIILATADSTDNEKAKKWYNRFQVSGGKAFDIISLKYTLDAETLYDLSCNMSDLSRRFDKDIMIDISGMDDISSASIGLEDIDSAINIVPLDKGFGTVYSDLVLDKASLVA
ncbi:MAG: glycosyl hydrolase 53 family protein [Eubacterium sp.]|nr:glycosyl hydrolase 53 family protein [Eubacterium sp.]MBR1673869.1 glycosyl hydrolase 53 family protein [Eubacterium sp.]